jgi:hypothetical protein
MRSKFKGMIRRTVLTSVGHVAVDRRYFACPQCRAKATPFDDWAGLGDRSLTAHARRMVTLAGTSWSFDAASRRLKELCHVEVSDDTIERVCQEEGAAATKWMDGGSPAPAADFTRAKGLPEFYTDGLKVNTVDGWREMRLSVFAKREPGEAATPAEWRQRVLPDPTVRLASCMIAPSNVVGSSWKRMADRLGLADSDELSVGADAARWIWDEARKRLSPHAKWFVDVFHVGERLNDCAKAVSGEGEAARAWALGRLDRLVELQGPGFIEELDGEIAASATGPPSPPGEAALRGLRSYLDDNRDSLWYAQRLAAGLPIGSGLIEGACKTMKGRLCLNAARWRVRRVERIGALKCLDYSGQWEAYWRNRAV